MSRSYLQTLNPFVKTSAPRRPTNLRKWADIKQDSIECPIIPARFGKSDVSDVQQQIFVSFLEMKSIEMMADQDNMMTVDVNKFSPKALNKLLELLQKNDPKIFIF